MITQWYHFTDPLRVGWRWNEVSGERCLLLCIWPDGNVTFRAGKIALKSPLCKKVDFWVLFPTRQILMIGVVDGISTWRVGREKKSELSSVILQFQDERKMSHIPGIYSLAISIAVVSQNHLSRLQVMPLWPNHQGPKGPSRRAKTIFFFSVFLGIVSRIFASIRIHWKRPKTL